MFDELDKYEQKGRFFFKPKDSLLQVCNAPTNQSGIYVVYALRKGKVELIYIGCSGKIQKDGSMFIRKAGLGGIKDRLVNGHQFGKIPRRISWANQMTLEDIEALDVYWYGTHNEKYMDCPRKLENKLLKKFFDIYGKLPRWNYEF